MLMLALLRRLTYAFALAGAAVALAVGAMTTASVVGRALFRSPIQGDVELTQVGMALAISLCVPWCQLRGANIIVDFFTQRLPARGIRWLDGVGALLLAAMCLLLAWRTGVGAVSVRQAREATMILDLPMWWAYASLAPGLGLAALVALVQAWLHFSGRPLAVLRGEDGA
jgi:TRAP-type C4-dicarboxylate transport system permease small subunit